MNLIIDGKQCTIIWHFDDPKTSHVKPTGISGVFCDIDAEYGEIAKITITWGRVQK